jgi:prenyl protein peptidase
LAHIHHFYEFTITHPGTPTSHALGRSLFQFAYTTLFGAYATFLYLRTGSLLAVVVVHSFCNWMGLPRIWGQVDVAAPAHRSSGELGSRSRIEDNVWDSSSSRLHGPTSTMRWTIAYYVLLVVGAFAFGTELWALTESPSALTRLGGAKQ